MTDRRLCWETLAPKATNPFHFTGLLFNGMAARNIYYALLIILVLKDRYICAQSVTSSMPVHDEFCVNNADCQ